MNVSTITFANTVTAIPLVTAAVRGTVSPFTATVNMTLQGDGATAGGVWRSFVAFGTTPSTTGRIRLTSTDGIYERTTAAADALLIALDGSDNIIVGDGTNCGSVGLDCSAGNAVVAMEGSVEMLEIDASGAHFGAAMVTPTFNQFDETVGAAGDLLTTHAQDATVAAATGGARLDRAGDATGGGASTGGSYDIRPGSGTTGGALALQNGAGTDRLTITDTGLDANDINSAHWLAAGYARFGLAPGSGAGAAASVGTTRFQSNVTMIAGRNAADGGDMLLLRTDGANNIWYGDVSGLSAAVYLQHSTTIHLRTAAANHVTLAATGISLAHWTAAGYARLGLVAGSGAGSAAATGGLRMQGNGAVQGRIVFRNNADAADAAGMSVDASDVLWVGGTNPTRPASVTLDGVAGVVNRVNGAYHTAFVSGEVDVVVSLISFRETVATPVIRQDVDTTAGVVGDLLTVHSQDVSSAGAAPTGGGLLVRAGDGTAGNGNGGDADFRPGAASGAGTPGTLALQDSTGADVLRVDATGLSTDLAIHHNRTVVNFGMTPYDRHLIVKDEGGVAVGANITVDANGGELIDGALTAVINANYGAIQLYCDGTGWYIY
jgi:hypothetical protein